LSLFWHPARDTPARSTPANRIMGFVRIPILLPRVQIGYAGPVFRGRSMPSAADVIWFWLWIRLNKAGGNVAARGRSVKTIPSPAWKRASFAQFLGIDTTSSTLTV
jgi:hypothetical protein